MKKFFYYLFHNPNVILGYVWHKIGVVVPDKLYLKVHYRLQMGMGEKLDLKNPTLFSEKLQWLKLYDRNPDYTVLVDKYSVKEYVSNYIGREHIIPTLGVWNRPEDIEWDKLPDRFCLKCTHDSGTIIIVKDKKQLNKDETIKKLNTWLKRDYYKAWREWPYKDVKHRIIAEQFVDPRPEASDLFDFKFFSFNGEPKVLLFCSERKNGTSKWDFYDMSMQRLEVTAIHHMNSSIELDKIINREVFEQMKNIARTLAKNKYFVSVDLYYVKKQIFFGELTFYSGAGFLRYDPADFDLTLGNMLELPTQKKI